MSYAPDPRVGSHHSIDSLTGGWVAHQGSPASVCSWTVQYRVLYVPIRVPLRCVVQEIGYVSATTATGNIDIGLYDASGVRLASTGSTAKSNLVSLIPIAITPVTIGPGLYYIALCNDTTTDDVTASYLAAPTPAAFGVLAETLGSVTLPATASWAVADTLDFLPMVAALLVSEIS